MKRNIAVWVLTAFSGCFSFCSTVLGTYQIIDLGTLGGNSSYAESINNNGLIVGTATNSSGDSRAVLFDASGSGNNLDLGTLTGYSKSRAYSINNNGQIVGYAISDSGIMQAAIFDSHGNGSIISLGIFSGNHSAAYSINNNGHIVGEVQYYHSSIYATLFDSTGAGNNKKLGDLNSGVSGYISEARSINDNDQIVGASYYRYMNSHLSYHAVLYDSTGAGHNVDLGTLPGYDYSSALSINNDGQIVGYNYISDVNGSKQHATLFDPTGAGNNIDLGTLGGNSSAACFINDNSQIVGFARNKSGFQFATLFDITGAGNNIDLNTYLPTGSGWTLNIAYSINDNGWIVGEGRNPSGQTHAYLLKPIPEPCTLALLALGGVGLLRKRRA